jgi:steroid 5-alpha reductase family enzyme
MPSAAWLACLPWLLVLALLAWVLCTARRNVGLIDLFWPLFLLLAAFCAWLPMAAPTPRAVLVLLLVSAWALRLSLHLALRNWNAPEDRRYRAIRARNEPGFIWKSLYLVFGLQALLAFVVSAPLHAAINAAGPVAGVLDGIGAVLVGGGIVVQATADRQLSAFVARSDNRGKVLDHGLWRYSRHPNYFGEFCIWWGFFLFAAATGAWWTIVSPLLMSLLLLRVSGVTLLERDIGERRPGYAEYAARTNAFFPGPRRPA